MQSLKWRLLPIAGALVLAYRVRPKGAGVALALCVVLPSVIGPLMTWFAITNAGHAAMLVFIFAFLMQLVPIFLGFIINRRENYATEKYDNRQE